MPIGMAAKHSVENGLVLNKWTDMSLDKGTLNISLKMKPVLIWHEKFCFGLVLLS